MYYLENVSVSVSVRPSQLFQLWSSSVNILNMSATKLAPAQSPQSAIDLPGTSQISHKTIKYITKLCSGQICFLDQFLLHQPQCLSVSVFVCHSIPSLQPYNSSNISLDMGRQLNDRCWMIPSDKWMTTATTTNIIFFVSFFSYIYIFFF